MALTIIGDVHGKIPDYVKLAQQSEFSLQLGDMGFCYDGLNSLSPDHHKFFGGNHDCYDIYLSSKHSLGDYGMTALGEVPFYFIRGGFSIDKKYRVRKELETGIKSWWPNEQLDPKTLQMAIDDYTVNKPALMITHECPQSIAQIIGNPDVLREFGFNPDTFRTDTQMALQACLEAHMPKLWVFGHFHRSWKYQYKDTTFICLNELESITINNFKNGDFT